MSEDASYSLSVSKKNNKDHQDGNCNDQNSDESVFQTSLRDPWRKRKDERGAESISCEGDTHNCIPDYLFSWIYMRNKSCKDKGYLQLRLTSLYESVK